MQLQAVVPGDLLAVLLGNTGLNGIAGPLPDGIHDLFQDQSGFGDADGLTHCNQIGAGEVIVLAVDGHLVLVGPPAGRVMGINDVIGRRQLPASLPVH